MANTVQVNYIEMRSILAAMANQQAEIQALVTNTRNMMEEIYGNTWIGQAADKFHDEMSGTLLVNLDKVGQGLGRAQEVGKQVINIFAQADEETRGYFRGII